MRWMELIQEHRVFLIRLNLDLWAEIQKGRLRSLELLRPGRSERVPEFRNGDVLLLYRPELPGEPPPALSHVIVVRRGSSGETGYDLGPLFRINPPIGKERVIFSSDRGSMPGVFQRADDRTFVMALLTSEERDDFLECMLTGGISLEAEAGKGGEPTVVPEGENPGIVEFEW